MEDAGLCDKDLSQNRLAIAIGTTMAESHAIEAFDSALVNQGVQGIPAGLAVQYPANMISSHVAEALGVTAALSTFGTACAAGSYALAYAYDLLQLGRADFVLAGGADAFSRIAFTGFNRLFAVAPERCQPFDKNRKGMIPGEGAAVLLLERYSSANARKARIFTEMLGYGISCDANHMTIPDVEGVKRVMLRALDHAGVSAEDIDYVNAHGTGTPANDRTECGAIKEVFGSHVTKLSVSATKSMIGHAMGAASALETVAAILALSEGVLPPTINFEEADPDCDVDCVPNKARQTSISTLLKNSFAFGGNNASVVFACKDPR